MIRYVNNERYDRKLTQTTLRWWPHAVGSIQKIYVLDFHVCVSGIVME